MILITGGAGYIGSHTTLEFLNSGYEVVVFDNLETGHLETIDILKKEGNLEFFKGDLKNQKDLDELFKKYNIEAVIHFAASSIVSESVKNPAKYYRNNVLGTLNLLDCMIKNNVKKIVFSSTCATYGEPKYVPLDENHPQNPINPYGQTKLMIEKIMDDYDRAYNLKSIRLRYFNVAGANSEAKIGEWHETETHLIPNILKSVFEKDKTFKIFGDDYNTPDGTCIRDYVNVEDLAKAHKYALLYLNKENKTDYFNIGTQEGDSVKKVFSVCREILKKEIPLEIAPKREGDPAILYANSKKAKEILNWKGEKNLKDSIKSAYEWEKKLQKIKKF